MIEITSPPKHFPRKISAGGLSTHYRQVGSGPPLVLIHGMMGSLADWQVHIVPLLTDKFTVLTYDLRGHGYTDMPPSGYTSADLAGDLVKLLDALAIGQVHVAGHSLGGQIALHFTALYPERVVALTASDTRIRALQPPRKLKDWEKWPLWNERLSQRGLELDPEKEMDLTELDRLIPQRTGPERKASPARRRKLWRKLLESTTAKADLADPAGLTEDLIRQIRIPVQGLFAELSFCMPTLAALRSLLPHLEAKVLPGVGHFFPVTRPELFAQHIKAFHSSFSTGSSQAACSDALGEECEMPPNEEPPA